MSQMLCLREKAVRMDKFYPQDAENHIMTTYFSVGSFLEMSFSSQTELQTVAHRLNGILIY